MNGLLSYHLRELRADLNAATASLTRIGVAPPDVREHVRGWLDVESLIEHDLDVHLPALASLLGAAQPAHTDADDGAGSLDEEDDLARVQVAQMLAVATNEMAVDPPGVEAMRRTRAILVRAHAVAARARARSVHRAELE